MIINGIVTVVTTLWLLAMMVKKNFYGAKKPADIILLMLWCVLIGIFWLPISVTILGLFGFDFLVDFWSGR